MVLVSQDWSFVMREFGCDYTFRGVEFGVDTVFHFEYKLSGKYKLKKGKKTSLIGHTIDELNTEQS